MIYRSPESAHLLQSWCRHVLAERLPTAHHCEIPTPLGPTHITFAGTIGPLVVFLPGTNLNAATSTPLVAELGRGHRVAVVDLPGQPGLSSPQRPDLDLVSAYGDWLDHVLTSVTEPGPASSHHEGPVVLVGESLGAAVALCATPDPRRVGGLLALAPAGLAPARLSASMLTVALPWLLHPTPATSRRMLTTLCGGSAIAEHDLLSEWLHLIGRHARTSLAPAPLPSPVLAGWRHTPRRVLTGDHDVFFPPHRLQLPTARLLHTDLTTITGGGHLLSHTATADVVDAVTTLAPTAPTDVRSLHRPPHDEHPDARDG